MVDVQKREDRMLEELHELYRRRDDTRDQIELWRLAQPELGEVLDDILVRLTGNQE